MSRPVLLVNFGGPRVPEELGAFMEALLTDQDVIQTSWPPFLHRLLFKRVARRRAELMAPEYHHMGGSSPIFRDTEELAWKLQRLLQRPVLTFHRYLPATHQESLRLLECSAHAAEQVDVLPLFPQFSYSTTGSCARWLERHLAPALRSKLTWVQGYPDHTGFIEAYHQQIQRVLSTIPHTPEKTVLLFSAHGLPQRYVDEGDPYQKQCQRSVAAVAALYPGYTYELAFQSRYGPEEWLKPYTVDLAAELRTRYPQHDLVLVVPIAFTSDHLETLVEIEQQVLPLLQERGFRAQRVPSLQNCPEWPSMLVRILEESERSSTRSLIRDF